MYILDVRCSFFDFSDLLSQNHNQENKMGKISLMGILSLFGSMVLFAFELIGRVMENKQWQAISLLDLIGQDKGEWIASINSDIAQKAINLIFKDPLYVPLFIVAVILLIISGFAKK